jgi:phospholipase C
VRSLRVAALVFVALALLAFPAQVTGTKDAASPIKHVVIIVRENHTFDNYFGTFPGVNGLASAPASVHPFHVSSIHRDLCHSWKCAHMAYDHGRMDSFAKAADSNLTFGYFDGRDIPYYWGLARNYTLFDNYTA